MKQKSDKLGACQMTSCRGTENFFSRRSKILESWRLLHPGHFGLEEQRGLAEHFCTGPDKEEKVVLLVDGQLDVPEALGADQVVEDGGPLQVKPSLQRLFSAFRLPPCLQVKDDVARAPQHVLQ